MDAITFDLDMFCSPQATYTPTKRLGNELSRLSRIQNGKRVVTGDYVK